MLIEPSGEVSQIMLAVEPLFACQIFTWPATVCNILTPGHTIALRLLTREWAKVSDSSGLQRMPL
jgi:hypothetical protein